MPQPPVFPLGPHELHGVWMTDIKCGHLRPTTASGGRNREAHLVVNIHKAERARSMGAGAGNIGAFRAERGKLIANTAACFQRQARLMHLVENTVHGIRDGPGDGAVNGRSSRLVLLCSGIGNYPSSRNGSSTKSPQERRVPFFPVIVCVFSVGQCACHSLVGFIDGFIDYFTGF